jgi:uncharacterized membrane protein YidH (DUF202 family)
MVPNTGRSETAMWSRGIAGVVLGVVGIVFILQGTNVMHGSGMSAHGQWTVVGVVLIVLGLASLAWAAARRRSATEPS